MLGPYFLQQVQLHELLGQSVLLQSLQTLQSLQVSQAPPSLSEIGAKVEENVSLSQT